MCTVHARAAVRSKCPSKIDVKCVTLSCEVRQAFALSNVFPPCPVQILEWENLRGHRAPLEFQVSTYCTVGGGMYKAFGCPADYARPLGA